MDFIYFVVMLLMIFFAIITFIINIELGLIAVFMLWCAWVHMRDIICKKIDKINKPFYEGIRKTKDKLRKDIDLIKKELYPVYSQYWELPPDWEDRRISVLERDNYTCQSCMVTASNSNVEFHVHHIVFRSKPEGNHDLNNLLLLCEVCHSDIESQGHQLIKGRIEWKEKVKEEKIAKSINRVKFVKRESRKEYICFICSKYILKYEDYYYGSIGIYNSNSWSIYPASTETLHVCFNCFAKYELQLKTY